MSSLTHMECGAAVCSAQRNAAMVPRQMQGTIRPTFVRPQAFVAAARPVSLQQNRMAVAKVRPCRGC
jgi:hypothetical protein